jgi:hypothetical protein
MEAVSDEPSQNLYDDKTLPLDESIVYSDAKVAQTEGGGYLMPPRYVVNECSSPFPS